MAKWKETPEPYIKVLESAKPVATNPRTGEDLIVAAVIISDSGPATPTLIRSQREYVKTYGAESIKKSYTDSLNDLYTSDPGSSLASTMWLNAYRLAGSTNLLVCRASKAKDLIYAKPLRKTDNGAYVLKNSEILKRVPKFKLVLDRETIGYTDGWAIAVSETGVIGNRVTDAGPVYDYKVDTLPGLIEQLNESTKFFSPSYRFFADTKCTNEVTGDEIGTRASEVVAVLFDEVYLGAGFLDQSNPLEDVAINDTGLPGEDGKNDYQVIGAKGTKVEVKGMSYLLAVEPGWEKLEPGSNNILDLNSKAFSGFEAPASYATNLYNSRSDLKVRIRRFNHNAVSPKPVSGIPGAAPESPWAVATKVLDKYTNGGKETPKKAVLDYDFFEFAVKDPEISEDWLVFNVGGIPGRGDITATTLNENLSMIHLTLPEDLHDLGLNYYGYSTDDYTWNAVPGTVVAVKPGASTSDNTFDSVDRFPRIQYEKNGNLKGMVAGKQVFLETKYYDVYKLASGAWSKVATETADLTGFAGVTTENTVPVAPGSHTEGDHVAVVARTTWETYALTAAGDDELIVDLGLRRKDKVTGELLTTILDVTDGDIMRAWDSIEEDERYVVEGMTDLGNTYSLIQNYMAGIAAGSNYFYAASTVMSGNYMTIANKKSKITKDTPKLYWASPWDYDDGTVGYLFNASPSVLYWECVSKNKVNNSWFAPAFGQNTGVVTPVKLATQFKRTERQLLLTKRINTVFYDVNLDRYYFNDAVTATTADTVRKEENIERSIIHISKNMPNLLSQFKGRINSARTRAEVEEVIKYWFESHMIPKTSGLIDGYRVVCDETESLNPVQEQRANRLNVKITVRYQGSIKYITVYNEAIPVGVGFDS